MDVDCIEDRTAKLEKLEQGVADFLAYIPLSIRSSVNVS